VQSQVLPLSLQFTPQIAMLGTGFPHAWLCDCIHTLRRQEPSIASLILTAADQVTQWQHFAQAGATGYLLTTEPAESMISAIRTLAMGSIWINPDIFSQLFAKPAGTKPPAGDSTTSTLTERELQVVHLVAQGWDNDRIAQTLGVSERTVRFHLRNIYDKLYLHNRSEAIVWAIQHGFSNRIYSHREPTRPAPLHERFP
jgi:two-component system, NarL family, response regulator DegU